MRKRIVVQDYYKYANKMQFLNYMYYLGQDSSLREKLGSNEVVTMGLNKGKWEFEYKHT